MLATQVINMASPFDPDTTGVGHQALGFDQWKLFYSHYVVLSSRIRVRLVGAASQTVPSVVGTVLLSSSSLTAQTWSELAEQTNAKFTFSPGTTNPGYPLQLWNNYDAKVFHNVKDVKDNTDRIGAATTASPADSAYCHIYSQAYDTATSAETVCIYDVVYKVLFSDPVELGQS